MTIHASDQVDAWTIGGTRHGATTGGQDFYLTFDQDTSSFCYIFFF